MRFGRIGCLRKQAAGRSKGQHFPQDGRIFCGRERAVCGFCGKGQTRKDFYCGRQGDGRGELLPDNGDASFGRR